MHMSARTDRCAVRGLARAAVVPAAALAVHQLRYLLAYGGGAGLELQRQGHSYLHSVLPWIVLATGLAVGAFLSALGQALDGHTSTPRFALSLGGLWLTCTACLIAIYAGQEFLEGMWATGHPAGVAGIFGYGGWWAIPAAGCVGLVLAALLHGARWALHEVAARRAVEPSPAPRARGVMPWPDAIDLPRPVPLALGWCGRGPPA
ncbi:MAG: hypothetical protein WBQ18_19620 [Solirubrobacteraceae bacterium]